VSIFLPATLAGSRIASVTFRLDGTVIRTERFAPFDFGSTAVNGSARLWNSATVANGSHVIAAEVRLRDGTVRTETATFRVANPRLLVSTSPMRSAAIPLDGATVTGPIAVFVPDTGSIRTVEFFLDGTRVSTERYAAYDLNSTATNGTARLLDVAPGTHTVRAVISYRSGLAEEVAATFERTT
jgi:hypothetical protein